MNLLVKLSVLSIILSTICSFSFANNWDNTHDVSGYQKNDGTYVQEHRAGNPNSGVHCSNNDCS